MSTPPIKNQQADLTPESLKETWIWDLPHDLPAHFDQKVSIGVLFDDSAAAETRKIIDAARLRAIRKCNIYTGAIMDAAGKSDDKYPAHHPNTEVKDETDYADKCKTFKFALLSIGTNALSFERGMSKVVAHLRNALNARTRTPSVKAAERSHIDYIQSYLNEAERQVIFCTRICFLTCYSYFLENERTDRVPNKSACEGRCTTATGIHVGAREAILKSLLVRMENWVSRTGFSGPKLTLLIRLLQVEDGQGRDDLKLSISTLLKNNPGSPSKPDDSTPEDLTAWLVNGTEWNRQAYKDLCDVTAKVISGLNKKHRVTEAKYFPLDVEMDPSSSSAEERVFIFVHKN
jgi:hypothetical protein